MSTRGAFAIVVGGDRKILLVRRTDAPLWDLPGGRVKKEEDVEACVIRETQEETGYCVRILNKIGVYQRPCFLDTQHVYLGEITGGRAIKKGDETSKLQWFSLNKLPILMVPHRKRQIRDYKRGKTNSTSTLKDSKILIMLMKRSRKHSGVPAEEK